VAHVQKRMYKSKRTGKVLTSWQGRYTTPHGEERSKRFARKVDAQVWVDSAAGDIARGAWIDPQAGTISLRDYANQWLLSRPDLRPTTLAKYRGLLDRHILPALGSASIRRIAVADVRVWHSELYQRHPSTAANAYRLLATICQTAVNDERIPRSPCRIKGASAEKSPERPTATVEEVGAETSISFKVQ
jgi:hypothetical protein